MHGDSPLSQRAAISKVRYCHVMYKLLYPSIRVRTAPPVSVSVRVRVLVLVLVCAYCSACVDLCDSGPESTRCVLPWRSCRSSLAFRGRSLTENGFSVI